MLPLILQNIIYNLKTCLYIYILLYIIINKPLFVASILAPVAPNEKKLYSLKELQHTNMTEFLESYQYTHQLGKHCLDLISLNIYLYLNMIKLLIPAF